jgi:hypothetical protein
VAVEIHSRSSRRYMEMRSMSKRLASTPKAPRIKPKVTPRSCPGEGALLCTSLLSFTWSTTAICFPA